MKVLLLKDINKLGKEGDVVEVKDGYARNWLLPQDMALEATKGNYKRLEEIKQIRSRVKEQEKQQALGIKEKIEKLSLTLTTEAKENEELYGAIGKPQIIKALASEGIELDKENMVLPEPIKKLGVYNLEVKLLGEVEATLRVWVVKQ